MADEKRLRHAARIIAGQRAAGNEVIVVLSAQGKTTDMLIEKANKVSEQPSPREMDMLLATGEQASVALCAMALQELGVPAISLAAWQAGIRSDGVHGNAHILRVEQERIRRELDAGKVVLAAGFQAVDSEGDLTTLGRGGSDTTAVALAAAFHADTCQIYTDVAGVYTADPNRIRGARKWERIGYDSMLALAGRGAKVLHDRCVEMAARCGVELEVLSSLEAVSGTRVVPEEAAGRMEIAGIAERGGVVSLVSTVRRTDELLWQMESMLSAAGIPWRDGTVGMSYAAVAVGEENADEALHLLYRNFFER